MRKYLVIQLNTGETKLRVSDKGLADKYCARLMFAESSRFVVVREKAEEGGEELL